MLLAESILGYADLFNTPRAPKNQMNTDTSTRVRTEAKNRVLKIKESEKLTG